MTTTADRDRKDYLALVRKANKWPVPEGFIGEFKSDDFLGPYFVMTNGNDINLKFWPGGHGTTEFKAGDTWYNFDRRGVESSFYWKPYFDNQIIDIPALIDEQLKRVAKRQEFLVTALKVPQIGFNISPDALPTLKRELQKKGFVRFIPSGFGTGYQVSKRSPRTTYGVKRANKELEEFLGHSPLYVETLDCD